MQSVFVKKMSKVILPELGEGIACATVACWHFKVGEQVGQDDDVMGLSLFPKTAPPHAPAAGLARKRVLDRALARAGGGVGMVLRRRGDAVADPGPRPAAS